MPTVDAVTKEAELDRVRFDDGTLLDVPSGTFPAGSPAVQFRLVQASEDEHPSDPLPFPVGEGLAYAAYGCVYEVAKGGERYVSFGGLLMRTPAQFARGADVGEWVYLVAESVAANQ